MHWWSHWSRKWLWALDAELWSWNMCRCWCRSVGWCEDHTYYSYANVVGLKWSPFIICQATIIKLKILVKDWRHVSTSSISIPSSEIILLKPKVYLFITHLPTLSTSPPQKKGGNFAISHLLCGLFLVPDLTPFCQAAGHAPSKGHRRDKRAPSAAVPVTFFPAWMKRPGFSR